jgi:hypothetical protein
LRNAFRAVLAIVNVSSRRDTSGSKAGCAVRSARRSAKLRLEAVASSFIPHAARASRAIARIRTCDVARSTLASTRPLNGFAEIAAAPEHLGDQVLRRLGTWKAAAVSLPLAAAGYVAGLLVTLEGRQRYRHG